MNFNRFVIFGFVGALSALAVFAACSLPPAPRLLCAHPFMNGGMPTFIPEGYHPTTNGHVLFKDGNKKVVLIGATCISVQE